MIISDEEYYPILIDNIDIPITTEYFWVLNLEHRDFMLSPLKIFEEISTPTLTLNIAGYNIQIPCDWSVLIYSDETSQLDVIEASELTKGNFSAFLLDHAKNKIINNKITVVDYSPYSVIHTPTLHKHMMLCHPLGTQYWMCISPTDTYIKYLKDCVVGDII